MVTEAYGFVFRDPSEKAREMVSRDVRALSPSYTRSYGFVMSHGKGAEVWDVDGNQYIDFAAGIAVLSTGHAHPRVTEAIKTQVDRYLHIGATDFFSPEQVELGESLQRITPIHGASKPEDKLVYLGNSGTEAIESAIKLARYRENRKYIIGFYGGFHGRTMGALSVTASKATQRRGYAFVPGGVEHVPYPGRWFSERAKNDSYDWGDVVQFIRDFVLKAKFPPEEVAAIVVEPIQGEGGYQLPRDDFFPKLRQLCDDYGILLISDEVQAGMGRTGKWWGIEHWGVEADIVATAKGLGSGFPIGGMIAHKDVMGQWVPGAHASTFGGNPVAAAAAKATISVIEEENLLANATARGAQAITRLSALQAHHPYIVRVEGKGLMVGVEFRDAKGKPASAFRDEIVNKAYLHGLLTLAAGSSVIRIAPPLVITEAQMAQGLDILERAIAETAEAHAELLAGGSHD